MATRKKGKSRALPDELVRALEKPSEAKWLSLSNAEEIPREIAALTELENLSVFGKHGIETIAVPEELARLTKLKSLTLYFPIDEVPRALFGLGALADLTVQLTNAAAGEALCELSALRSLKVTIVDRDDAPAPMPVWMTRLTQLTHLTPIRQHEGGWSQWSIPDALASLVNLEALDFTWCKKYAALPAPIAALRKLRILKINVDDLTARIGALENLEELVLHYSELASLPREIGKLRKLKKLELAGTKLAALPAEIGELTALEDLRLQMNKLTELPTEIGRLAALKQIALPGNPLTELPDALGDLASLERIDIGADKRLERGLTSLPSSIGRLKKLDTIWTTDGRLETIPKEIGDCESMRTLYLNDQKIASLPRELGALTKLSWLHIKNNPLRALPEELLECPKLSEIDLSGCTFPAESMDVVEKLAKKCRLERPRLEEKRAAPPKTASKKRLAPAVLEQIARLGGRVASASEIPKTMFEKTKGGDWPIPEAIRQFERDVKWPKGVTFRGEEVWLVDFGGGANLDEYECTYYHPYYGIGLADGGNYYLLVDLGDETPEDPAVYKLDHESFAEHGARCIADKLSEILAGLAREKKRR
jgi:leucine-rich repeat protein SHOC2